MRRALLKPAAKSFDTRTMDGYGCDFDSRYGITLDANSKASQWDERFRNGMSWVQATAGNRPVVTPNGFGGAPKLTGVSANSVTMTANTALKALTNSVPGLTIYAIYGNTSLSTAYVMGVGNGTDGSGRLVMGNITGKLAMGERRLDADAATVLSGQLGNTFGISPYNFELDHTGGKIYIYKNNILVNQNLATGSSGNTSATNAVSMNVMASNGGGSYLDGDLVRLIICKKAHTAAQRAAYWEAIMKDYTRTSLLPVLGTSPAIAVQMHGDSITQGSGLVYPAPTLADRVWQALGSNTRNVAVNIGHSGATTATLTGEKAALIDILPVSTAGKVVYCLFVGTNDICVSAASGATAYASIKTLFQAVQASRPGVKIVICTPLARGDALAGNTQKTEIDNLRTQILTHAVADGANAVADCGGITQFATGLASTVYTNTTYYNADKIHPTDAGNSLLAPVIAAAIKAA